MKFHESENILIDYLDDLLSPEKRQEVENQLAQSPEMRHQMEELKKIVCALDAPMEYQPSENLQKNFLSFLEKEKNKSQEWEAKVVPLKKRNQLVKQLVAAAAILLLGIFIGKEITDNSNQVTKDDLAEVRTEMLNLLKENSTSARIKGVNVSYQVEKVDHQIVNALIKRMNEDKSTNVRLAATEALLMFSKEEKVRTALCHTLEVQKDPIIQILIIESLVHLKEKRAVKYFEKLIENDETTDDVKDEAQMGIFKMT